MSRNCRRSQRDIPNSSEEDDSADPAEGIANSETRSRSRSLASCELTDREQPSHRSDEAGYSSAPQTHGKRGKAPKAWFHNIRSSFARRHSPHILVEASKETKGRESEAKDPQETDNPQIRSNITEPISELPLLQPHDRVKDPSISHSVPSRYTSGVPKSESSLEEEWSEGKVTSTSDSDEYDREEPLITKTKKYYKKRPDLIPIYDDSEDSRLAAPASQKDLLQSRDLLFRSQETHSPGSSGDYTGKKHSGQKTPSSSEEPFSLGPGERNFLDLREGLVFIYMVIPPDGGYGWVVMIISFLCQLIVDGIILTIGTILPYIGREFKTHESVMVLVASVQIGCYFLSGAFGSILISRFAFRTVAITGAFISMLTFVAGSFSPRLGFLIVLYSAIGGCAMSLIWCSSQLIVACYFERYRPLANGFSCSGAGAGTIFFSLLNNYLLPIIGWRHMLRVQAGAMLLVMLMAIAYVEVRPVKVGVMPENTVDSSPDEYYGNFYVHDYLRVSSDDSYDSGSLLSFYDPDTDKRKCCPCLQRYRERRKARKDQKRWEREHNMIIRTSYTERDDIFYTGPAEYDDPHSKQNIEGKEITLVGTEKNTQQVTYGIQHINDRRVSPEVIERRRTLRQPPRKRFTERKFMVNLSRLFDYHLFKQFEFLILVAAAFLFPMGFNIPFVYSKARTTVHKDYANLITPAIGLTNFAFRIACGFVAFKRRNWTRNICGGGLVFGGCFVFVSAFFGKDLAWFQILYGLCYGVAPAVYSTLRAIIYVKYLGLGKLTNAFGITALAMGFGVFTGTTIAGLLVGDSHNYTAAFIFAGGCLISAGVLKLLLPTLVHCKQRRMDMKKEKERRMDNRKTVREIRKELGY